jgi:uncharacterized membrane protein
MGRFRLGFAFLALFALMVHADPADAVSFSVTGIKASRFLVSPEATVSITAQLRNTDLDRAEGISIVLSLSDPFGNEVPGSERIVTGQTFNAGQRRTYHLQWPAPEELTPGLYTASIGVFSSDWSQMYTWQTQDSAFVVKSDELQFAVQTTSVTPQAATPGRTIRVTTRVVDASSVGASDIIVMCELNSEDGDTNFAGDFRDHQSFRTGQTRSFAFVLELPEDLEAGTYTIDVAVFAGGWSQLYTYRFVAATFTVQ